MCIRDRIYRAFYALQSFQLQKCEVAAEYLVCSKGDRADERCISAESGVEMCIRDSYYGGDRWYTGDKNYCIQWFGKTILHQK